MLCLVALWLVVFIQSPLLSCPRSVAVTVQRMVSSISKSKRSSCKENCVGLFGRCVLAGNRPALVNTTPNLEGRCILCQ